MKDEVPPAGGIDVTRPSVARVYDFWLGGKDNFAADRDMGSCMAELNPALPQLVRQNRQFVCAAAVRAAAAGPSQFLDPRGRPARGGAARGSWLIVSCGHYPDEELAARLQQTATHARFWNHDAADLASFLAGLEPVAPGVCEARRWIAGTGGVPSGKNAYALAAVGAKPQ
jgi:hypothetical protein